ncbi:hypothetical protein ACWD5F_22930 [Streptomyces sp. NPDC002499]
MTASRSDTPLGRLSRAEAGSSSRFGVAEAAYGLAVQVQVQVQG